MRTLQALVEDLDDVFLESPHRKLAYLAANVVGKLSEDNLRNAGAEVDLLGEKFRQLAPARYLHLHDAVIDAVRHAILLLDAKKGSQWHSTPPAL